MDTNKKPNNFIAGFADYIKDCLRPLYQLHCLKYMYYDPEFMNSILMYVATQDNRLTFFMYGKTE